MVRSARNRREAIVEMAQRTEMMSVDGLAEHFAVTASTIRRDLARLDESGQLTRTYGGVRARLGNGEATLRERLGEAHEAKERIARRARAEILPAERIMLDAGTTVAALAHELREAQDLQLVLAGVTSLQMLADSELEIELIGGRLRHISQGLIGPLAEAAVERMTVDRVFLGTDGVDPELGLNEAELAQTRLKELMASRAAKVYVLAHHEKLGLRDFHAWARIPVPWTLITDSAADPEIVAAFRAAGVEVLLAE